MTIDDVQSSASDLADHIQRHKLLGTPLDLQAIEDHLSEAMDFESSAPDDVECDACDEHETDTTKVACALSDATRRGSLLEVTLALARVYSLLGYTADDATGNASALVKFIQST